MGVSKGLAMSRIINSIAERVGHGAVQFDFVLVAGHFLARDENIFTFFEGQSLKVGPSILDAPQPTLSCPACLALAVGRETGCMVLNSYEVEVHGFSEVGCQWPCTRG